MSDDMGIPERPERKEPEWSEANIRTGFTPSEPWGTVHELTPTEIWEGPNGTFAKNNGEWEQINEDGGVMGWPAAISNIVTALSVSAILIVLFLVLWGPWGR